MISASRRWLRRNRNGIAIGAGVVGATYLAGQYVLSKINEARDRSHLDRVAKENIRRRFEQNQTDCTITVLALLPTLTENVLDVLPVEQLTHELQQKKAERLARASAEGAMSEASSLRDGDTASLSSFQTGGLLQTNRGDEDGSQPRPRRTKAQLWNELKVSSITRAFTLIYTLSLLILLTRIQLNLLGRLNYLSSVVTLARPPPPGRANSISLEDHDDGIGNANFGNDFETNRKYLTFSWYLLHRGYARIMIRVRNAVEEVFGTISPNEGLTAARLSELCLAVRRRVEGSTDRERYATRWLADVLPQREDEESVLIESGVITPPSNTSASSPDPPSNSGPNQMAPSYVNTASGPLRQLLDETADLIDSPTFTRIHTLMLDTMISHLIDSRVLGQLYPQTAAPFPPTLTPDSLQPRIEEVDSAVTVVPAEPRVKLASILAVLTRQAHAIGNGADPPNEYIAVVDREVKELEAFAAVIYAGNLDQSLEEARPRTSDGPLKTANGSGASQVGSEQVDEMTESTLESAWEKVTGSIFSSR